MNQQGLVLEALDTPNNRSESVVGPGKSWHDTWNVVPLMKTQGRLNQIILLEKPSLAFTAVVGFFILAIALAGVNAEASAASSNKAHAGSKANHQLANRAGSSRHKQILPGQKMRSGIRGGSTRAGVLGYREWKSIKVQEARQALGRVQQEYGFSRDVDRHRVQKKRARDFGPWQGPQAAELQARTGPQSADQRREQAQLNLEVAQGLSVHDYFVIYLSQLENKQALKEAVKKMSQEDIVELLIAYKKQNGKLPDGIHSTESRVQPRVGSPSKPAAAALRTSSSGLLTLN